MSNTKLAAEPSSPIDNTKQYIVEEMAMLEEAIERLAERIRPSLNDPNIPRDPPKVSDEKISELNLFMKSLSCRMTSLRCFINDLNNSCEL